ncbi:hypothetical protein MSTO_57820 [Mycobacterium stomatepiae]|uniref:Uncharacterized protein n=1 Tax=Mycobacterium stomatepiae TaxID=470076 RepID=A0A7I7QHN3_9MYCO|nr:hypothetical protein MSTO_57820 [Mycobacterium stomatepiae]
MVPAGSTAAPLAPAPAIAELTIGAGVEPCHTGGTEMAPTNRALPRPAEMDEPQLPSPLIMRIAGPVEPTVCDAPVAATLVAPASDVTGAVPWLSAIIGGINALAGYIPIWAADIKDDTGADVTIDPTWDSADWIAVTAEENPGPNICPPNDDNAPVNCEANVLSGVVNNPAKLDGAEPIDGNADMTDCAPAW